MAEPATTSKSKPWVWVLWWQIDPVELERQVSEYDSLPIYRSMRGISVLCLAFSAAVTTASAFYGIANIDATAYFDAATMLLLAVFIFFGHRWAMIGAMIVWTAEKIISLSDTVTLMQSSGGLIVSQLIWWALYMHAFYFAFRIEQRRTAIMRSAPPPS